MGTRLLRIGEVANACAVSVDTVRHYERLGLLPNVVRTSSNQRRYSPKAIARVELVRRAVRFGFSLPELARFMKARDNGHPPCRAVRDAAEHLFHQVESQLAELMRRRDAMEHVLRDWDQTLAGAAPNGAAGLLERLPAAGPTGPTHRRGTPMRRPAR
jgi:DNA-binding transcriptional MerR regulator